MLIPWYVTLTRLLVPFLILRLPLIGMLASIFADVSDWKRISVTTPETTIQYQTWDKLMDSYSFIFVIWIVLKWKDVWARRMAIRLFVYRIIGVLLFLATQWRPFLFFFPNVFENFVIFCLLLFWLFDHPILNLDTQQKNMILVALIVPKLVHEYYLHVLEVQPWEVYNLSFIPENMWSIFTSLLLYVFPAGLIILGQRKKLNTNP